MVIEVSRERLKDLLVDPRESPDFEVKNWLDLQGSNEDKATVAKAILAIANSGGGFVALGLLETDAGVVEAEGRPADFEGYSQDLINGIVHNYCDPPFHCAVHIVPSPEGALYPIVVVPGGHRVPVRARRAGPHGNIVTSNAIYVRKPGPRSETPQSAQEWDALLDRCLRNRRDDMFDQIRDLITGAVPQIEREAEPAALEEWTNASHLRWEHLVEPLAENSGPRFPHGSYCFAYEIIGERRHITPAQFSELLKRSETRYTGWPPFWYPTREGIEPYPIDGSVECWLGGDPQMRIQDNDPAHSDYWRVSPEGFAFLLRGFQEDGDDLDLPPATAFDVTLPIWRVGETLLHARRLANNLFEGTATIRFSAIYSGLAGRALTSIEGRRLMRQRRVARQNTIELSTHIDANSIDPNLPEIVQPLLSPLYGLFDFFELPMQLVTEELSRMRSGNF
ncbi:hypothetical protein PsAD13_04975 [Pseudovibrio sp. Ad13]|uniref:AlbA family DNA-binding domain-containing protein n=1 Tax=unclassified Pseudovibrio TaxID=2627060 RepID=UPI0007AE6ED3|nr:MULTISPECIES: hypothetical protein [unclassified Pseudovibrio]KZK79984.1 hypothetical protein PsAD13_04975 [Pseudovibrio sp. Ad13]